MDPVTAAFVRFRTRGDLGALGEVFDASAQRLLALALHLCGNAADAEDALQATFVVAMQKAAEFDAARPIGPWLAGILAGEARSAARRTRRSAPAPAAEHAAAGDPAADAERRELIATLRTHIEALPAEQRQVLLLQLQYGLQPAEIAEVVGAPPGTVRMRLHRGLVALRGVLPASLVAMLATLLPSRGIAAVRANVLRAAARHATAAAVAVSATGTAGVLAMIAAGAFAVAIVGGLWWSGDTSGSAVPVSAAVADTAVAAKPADPDGAAGDERMPGATTVDARVAPETETRALRVQVRAAMRMAHGRGASFMGGAWCPPVPGVDVVVWPDPAGGPVGAPARRARTNESGRVEWPDVPVGRWHLRVRCGKAEVGAKEIVVDAATAATTVELDLLHGGTVQGRVVDMHGGPVAGAEVWIGAPFEAHEWSQPQLRRAWITGPTGSFQCCLFGGETRVVARQDGYATSWAQPVPQPGDGGMTLVLGEQAGAVRVLVRGAVGEVLPELTVALQPVAATVHRAADGSLIAPPLPVQARALPDGSFVAEGLLAGPHHCRVQAPGRTQASTVDVVAGQVADVVVDFAFGMAVRGTVRDPSGRPCPGFVVSLTSGSASRTLASDAAGAFSFENVERAPFTLQVMRGGVVVGARDVVPSLIGDSPCDVEAADLPTLRGRVVDGAGNGLAGQRVGVRRAGEVAELASAATRHDGAFVVCGVPDTDLDLTVDGARSGAGSPLVRVTHSSLAEPAMLVVPDDSLPRGVALGRLVDEHGQPVTDASVSIDGHWTLDYVFGVPEGRFRFERLPEGTFTLRASAPGRVPLSRRGEVKAGEPCDLGDVVLSPGASLRVRFLRPDGSPWRERPPVPRVESVGDASCSPEQAVDGDGVVAVSRIAPGRYRVMGPDDDELLVESRVVDAQVGAPVDVVLPTAVGRRRELCFGADPAALDGPLDVEVRRNDGQVVLQKTLTRGRTGLVLPCVLPVGDVVVEARRAGAVTHRADLTVGSRLDERPQVTVPPVR